MSSQSRRVVITGVGVISPLGNTKEAFWEALSAGRSGVGPVQALDPEGLSVRVAAPAGRFHGEIDDFGPLDKEQKKAIRKGLKMMCRECQMGVAVAQLALSDARVAPGQLDPDRAGISYGTDFMLSPPDEFVEGVLQCLDAQSEFHFSRWGAEGMPKMSPLWLLKYLPNMPASHVAIYNDFRGPNNSLTLREAGANAAVGEAFEIIRRSSADAMLCGAAGTRLHAMKTLHAVTQEEVAPGNGDPARVSRPFDRDRTGMVLGEGAGAIMLEELRHAQARHATIYGEILAAASRAAVGPRMAARHDRAMAGVLRALLEGAGLPSDEIGHLHAHGLSTRSGDRDEARAVHEVFAGRSRPLPVVAAKSFFGNLGAGGGMVELIASLLAMHHRRLFRVLNYESADPECPVAAVTDDSTPPGDLFINLSITPQGQASGVLVRRFE
ncbi:MAG: beta-ketoacyl-[acyl-carrier-protein] synthase family protein [Thermoguttaceae bacterium]|jgi:3-oxoacyl-[acyl-carrier-protein] synthase II